MATIRPTVLLVDDERGFLEMGCALLELEYEGCRVLTATDGLEALDILLHATERLVVLLDTGMPRMRGQEVLKRLDKAGMLNQHAFIIWCADRFAWEARDTDFVDLLRRYDVSVLEKPFAIDGFLECVEHAAKRLRRKQDPTSPS